MMIQNIGNRGLLLAFLDSRDPDRVHVDFPRAVTGVRTGFWSIREVLPPPTRTPGFKEFPVFLPIAAGMPALWMEIDVNQVYVQMPLIPVQPVRITGGPREKGSQER